MLQYPIAYFIAKVLDQALLKISKMLNPCDHIISIDEWNNSSHLYLFILAWIKIMGCCVSVLKLLQLFTKKASQLNQSRIGFWLIHPSLRPAGSGAVVAASLQLVLRVGCTELISRSAQGSSALQLLETDNCFLYIFQPSGKPDSSHTENTCAHLYQLLWEVTLRCGLALYWG